MWPCIAMQRWERMGLMGMSEKWVRGVERETGMKMEL